MRLTFGLDFFDLRSGKKSPVTFESDNLINSHLLIVGASGTGKSYLLRRLIDEACAQGSQLRFHIFDVHGDLDVPGASSIQFSEQSPYGLNPFRVNPNHHFGGVRKSVQNFIKTVNQASRVALGGKQEAVIRNLLLDVFENRGFYPDKPETWAVNAMELGLLSSGADNRLYLNVPYAEKDKARALGARWDTGRNHWWVHTEKYKGDLTQWPPAFQERSYPTLDEVIGYCKRLHVERFMGSDQKAVRALQDVHRKARSLHTKKMEAVKNKDFAGYDEEEEKALDSAREKAISAYVDYVNILQTGQELESLLKYDSSDVLKSVLDRLENLKSTGLFKDKKPAFDENANVWRYQINALTHEEKRLFVFFTLQNLFYDSVQRGEQQDVKDVVVLDELGVYTGAGDDSDGIIGTIAREARKFGLALWAASQTPTNVPESLASSVGTKVILGIDEMYWAQSLNKLRIEQKLLEWVRPTKSLAVQMKERGSLKNRWRWVAIEGY